MRTRAAAPPPPPPDDVTRLRRPRSPARVRTLGLPAGRRSRRPRARGLDGMKETPLSNCERRFLLRAIEEKKVNGPGGVRAAWALGWPGRPLPSGWDAPPSRSQAPVGTAGAFPAPPGFIWLQRVLCKARVTPTSCQRPSTSFPLSSGDALDPICPQGLAQSSCSTNNS